MSINSDHKITLIYKESTFHDEIILMDISISSARLSLLTLPSGIQIGDTIKVSMLLPLENKRIIHINTEATVYLIETKDMKNFIVITYTLNNQYKDHLEIFLSQRQRELILEFKSI